MQKKDHFISLRRDLPHVLWSGIRLCPNVDIEFRLDPFSNGCCLIRLRLAKPDGSNAIFTTGSSFDMSSLGRDHARLERLEANLVAITRYISKIAASMEPDGGVLLCIDIEDDTQFFRLYAKEPGQPVIDRWDWFLDPAKTMTDGIPIHVPRPVSELRQQAA